MPKKKGLGRDVDKSVSVMDDLVKSLNDFSRIPIKKGLKSNGVSDEKLTKMINEAFEKASALSNLVEDIKEAATGIKTDKNSRFASRIARKFISESL